MSPRVIVEVDLPKLEAESLTARARMENVKPERYLGIQVLRGAFGVLHPEVIAYEKGDLSRDDLGQVGTESGKENG